MEYYRNIRELTLTFYSVYMIHRTSHSQELKETHCFLVCFHSIGSEQENYPLRIGRYYGNAGDSLSYQRNMNFSTPDRDNDKWFGSCARRDRAGWWFRDCGFATLNSQYHNLYNSVGRDSLRDGILWFHWHKDDSQSLQKVEIKIKPTAV